MHTSLADRLSTIDSFRQLRKEVEGVIYTEDKLSRIEQICVNDFYSTDQLARDVASGKNSYAEMIKPIEAKYRSFWQRVRKPKKDEKFDKYVDDILASLDNVWGTSLDYFGLKTTDRRDNLKSTDLQYLKFGVVFSALFGALSYIPEARSIMLPAIPLVLTSTFCAARQLQDSMMNYRMSKLREVAQKTDEFLSEYRA